MRSAGASHAEAGLRLRLPRPSSRPALMASVPPIWRLGIGAGGAACAAVVINEQELPSAVDREAFAEAFRLTRREAQVAALIGEGESIERIGATLGLGPGTVRNHLKRIFAKTDAHSQSALVARVRGFAGPLR
jgi:DNA-binding CsgD family transcriptional regulator